MIHSRWRLIHFFFSVSASFFYHRVQGDLVDRQQDSCATTCRNLNGDYIIAAALPITDHTSKKKSLNMKSISLASTIIYAVDQINNNPSLLPGITIGYDIRDSCNENSFVTQHTLDHLLDPIFFAPALNKNSTQEGTCIPRGSSYNRVFGVVGAEKDSLSTAINNLLQVDFIPQVSYDSASTETWHRSFARTVPSDLQQAQAIADMLHYFEWSYVSIFVADDAGGRLGLDQLRKLMKKKNICISGEVIFDEEDVKVENKSIRRISDKETEIIISHLEEFAGRDHVVVMWSSFESAKHVIKCWQDPYYRSRSCMLPWQQDHNNTVTWIATQAWAKSTAFKNVETNWTENIIGLEIPTIRNSDFLLRPRLILPHHCKNPWFRRDIRKIRLFRFGGCRFDNVCDVSLSRLCQNILRMIALKPFYSNSPRIGQLLAAVYALVNGLHRTLGCTTASCYAATGRLSFRRVYENMLNTVIRVPDLPAATFRLNEKGDLADVSYNYIFINPRLEKEKKRIFGNWTSNGIVSSIYVDETKIVWGDLGKPLARCNDDCKPGFYRVNSTFTSCCWSCVRCYKDTFTSRINQPKCDKCDTLPYLISNDERDQCLKLSNTRMSIGDGRSLIHLVLAVFGILSTLFVVCVFLKYWETPVVKSASREMSFVQLLSMMILFAYGLLHLLPDTWVLCMVLVVFFAFFYGAILSLILVKTYRLFLVFRERFTAVSRFLHNKYQIAFSYIFVMLILTAVALWFLYFPAKLKVVIHRDNLTYFMRCEPLEPWYMVFTYMLLLELVILGMAFRARKLPANFNEVWYIVLTMFTDIVLWCLVFFTLYLSLPPRDILDVFLAVNFLSNFIKLFILYGYRIRIILFYPELNSPEHFRQTAVGSTVTNFIKDVQRDDGTNIRRVTSVVSFPSVRRSEADRLLSRSSVTLSTVYACSSPPGKPTILVPGAHRPLQQTQSKPSSPVKQIGADEGFGSDVSSRRSSSDSNSPLVDSGVYEIKRSIPDIRKWASSLLLGDQRSSLFLQSNAKDDTDDNDDHVFHLSSTRRCRSMDCLRTKNERLENLRSMDETDI